VLDRTRKKKFGEDKGERGRGEFQPRPRNTAEWRLVVGEKFFGFRGRGAEDGVKVILWETWTAALNPLFKLGHQQKGCTPIGQSEHGIASPYPNIVAKI
jgi:hypothetical protein